MVVYLRPQPPLHYRVSVPYRLINTSTRYDWLFQAVGGETGPRSYYRNPYREHDVSCITGVQGVGPTVVGREIADRA